MQNSSIQNYCTLLRKAYRYLKFKIRFFFKEKKYGGRLKYIFENNDSEELIVVFSGFAKRVPKYNYMRTLKDVNIDKLFILDDFGSRGSYHWFVDGTDLPLQLTKGLIGHIRESKNYKKIYTAGSSKGGTCAIYFGLEFQADEIFAGACQYHVGTYISIPKHRDVLEGMMGKGAGTDEVKKLDSIMPALLRQYAHCKSRVHLCYSREEHTYPEHIADLIEDLKRNDIPYVEIIYSYTSHADNGIYFSAYLKKYFGIQSL